MIHILSPAKSLDFDSEIKWNKHSQAHLIEQSKVLIAALRKKSPRDIQQMMSISENLAELNHRRYQEWNGLNEISERSRQAVLAFTGDVYQGLNASSLGQSDLKYAQDHLRILSGLYGLLKPLDLIEPYRLEMGTKLKVGKHSSLYDFWGDQISHQLNQSLKDHSEKIIINLASQEYFKAVKKNILEAEVISPQFKDAKNGTYKVISFYAKKARGLMSRYIIEHKINHVEELKAFDYGAYRYNPELSTEKEPVFSREENQS